MSTIISITLSDVEARVLTSIAVDSQEWISNIVASRIATAMGEIVTNEVTHLVTSGLPVPPTRDAIVASALDNNRVQDLQAQAPPAQVV